MERSSDSSVRGFRTPCASSSRASGKKVRALILPSNFGFPTCFDKMLLESTVCHHPSMLGSHTGHCPPLTAQEPPTRTLTSSPRWLRFCQIVRLLHMRKNYRMGGSVLSQDPQYVNPHCTVVELSTRTPFLIICQSLKFRLLWS